MLTWKDFPGGWRQGTHGAYVASVSPDGSGSFAAWIDISDSQGIEGPDLFPNLADAENWCWQTIMSHQAKN